MDRQEHLAMFTGLREAVDFEDGVVSSLGLDRARSFGFGRDEGAWYAFLAEQVEAAFLAEQVEAAIEMLFSGEVPAGTGAGEGNKC